MPRVAVASASPPHVVYVLRKLNTALTERLFDAPHLLRRAGLGRACAYIDVAVNSTAGGAERALLLDLCTGERIMWTRARPVFSEAFSRVYKEEKWGSQGGGSGGGSTVQYTEVLREGLTDLLLRYKIKSMVDASCGSMAWMPLVLRAVQARRPGFRFQGNDVVCGLIEKHRATFSNESNWRFDCVDYSNEPLPKGYDLIWNRDSLQHVPFHAIYQFLNNVKASGARYLLVSSFPGFGTKPIEPGEYYPQNLQEAPFKLRPEPLAVVDEQSKHRKKMMLFEVAKLEWDDALSGLP